MVSAFVKAELTASVSSLGYTEGTKYFKDQYCLEALKDLIRYLRRDDDKLEIRRELGQMKLVQSHLVPILCEYHKDDLLFDVTLRLLTNLTNPSLLLFNEELPTDKVVRNYYMQHVSHLQSYKPIFSSDKLWTVLTDKLKLLLIKEPEDRLEDDRLLTERILILIRNILDIPATPEDEKQTDDDASVHDQVLWSMHLSGMEDVISYLASSENERQYCMHILEIVSLMLREQNPAALAQTAAQRSVAEQQKDTTDLVTLVQRETAEREAKYKKMTASRSSIFRGTFCVKDVKSISEKELIVHRSMPDVNSIDFNQNKKAKRKPKNTLPLACNETTRRSTLSIRLMLKEFCLELLNGAYNSLMHVVKDSLVRRKAQENDETYYLWSLKFFMEFNRSCPKFRVDLVSETMSVGLFHYIQTLVSNYSEMLVVDKKKIPIWSRRLHMALRAYQELLFTLGAMDKYATENVRNSSKVLKGNIFYVPEYREMCLVLLQSYKEHHHSLAYLKDLVETNHIFLKLFQEYCQTNRHVVIQNKKTKRVKKKSKKKKKETNETTVSTDPPVLFDEIAVEISSALQEESSLPDGISPFDAASDLSMEDQKIAALSRIQKLLKESGKIQLAVAFLRASREVWPEGEVFGAPDIRPEGELLLLRELFYADLPDEDQGPVAEADDEEEDSAGDEIEEEEMASVKTSEKEIQFDEFIRRFAHCKIIQAYCLLLRHYGTNSTLTNHCIVKILHRVAFDCKMPAMLFQASLFVTFQKILNDPRMKIDSAIKELGKFAIYILRKFAETAAVNRKVFAELLFWKTARDAVEIEAGYRDVPETKGTSRSVWREEEEDELERLYHEFKDVHDPERDVVDRIMANLINQERNRRVVIKKMKEMGLISGVKELKAKNRVRPTKEWADEEIEELRRIFEEVRDSSDPLGLLVDRLTIHRSKKRIRDKIVELALVENVSELRKKRSSKKDKSNKSSGPKKHLKERHPESDRENSSSSESEGEDSDKSSSDDDRVDNNHRDRARKYGFNPLDVENFDPKALVIPFRQLVEKGHKEGLTWLLDCLREAREDRQEEDGDDAAEAIPILPLTEAAVTATEDHNFLTFMAKLGMAPPANEQEQYWRIPAVLKPAALKYRMDFLEKSLDGSFSLPEKSPEEESSKLPESKRILSDDDEESSTLNKSKRRRILADSSSEDEVATPADDPGETPSSTVSPGISKNRKSRLAILDSDSD